MRFIYLLGMVGPLLLIAALALTGRLKPPAASTHRTETTMTRIVPVRITKTPPATALPATSNWRARGACRGEDPDLFFPVGKNRHQVAQAKAVCARCPVSATCLAWALETCQADGIWGGMDARDRVLGRRGLRRAARDAA